MVYMRSWELADYCGGISGLLIDACMCSNGIKKKEEEKMIFDSLNDKSATSQNISSM